MKDTEYIISCEVKTKYKEKAKRDDTQKEMTQWEYDNYLSKRYSKHLYDHDFDPSKNFDSPFQYLMQNQFISSERIQFSLENSQKKNIVYYQKHQKLNELILNFNSTYQPKEENEKQNEENDLREIPSLFIFLIDQSGSMSGEQSKWCKKPSNYSCRVSQKTPNFSLLVSAVI